MKSARSPAAGSVRIIGGQWRGTRLAVPDRPGLRPTGDRVRETLFNWLMPDLAGARVLDLFAGSGALGLEAASRGAAATLLVERDPGLAQALAATVSRLNAQSQVQVVADDALRWLAATSERDFDIVFLDPPFAGDWWEAAISGLAPLLANDARVYLESPLPRVPRVPSDWQLHRDGQTREVRFALYRVHGAATLPAELAPEP